MQVILVEVYGWNTQLEEIKLGKLTKKTFTFEDYVWKALDKLHLDKSKVGLTPRRCAIDSRIIALDGYATYSRLLATVRRSTSSIACIRAIESTLGRTDRDDDSVGSACLSSTVGPCSTLLS
jgi:hypothetical protein